VLQEAVQVHKALVLGVTGVERHRVVGDEGASLLRQPPAPVGRVTYSVTSSSNVMPSDKRSDAARAPGWAIRLGRAREWALLVRVRGAASHSLVGEGRLLAQGVLVGLPSGDTRIHDSERQWTAGPTRTAGGSSSLWPTRAPMASHTAGQPTGCTAVVQVSITGASGVDQVSVSARPTPADLNARCR
jgi:hypothetical protein